MTDKELLEKAAKAAGMPLNFKDGWVWCENVGSRKLWGMWKAISYPTSNKPNPRPIPMPWNPLTDDGDALRLAVKLGLDVCIDTPQERDPHTHVIGFIGDSAETLDSIETHGDPYAATRRAIVRAAAAIGETME